MTRNPHGLYLSRSDLVRNGVRRPENPISEIYDVLHRTQMFQGGTRDHRGRHQQQDERIVGTWQRVKCSDFHLHNHSTNCLLQFSFSKWRHFPWGAHALTVPLASQCARHVQNSGLTAHWLFGGTKNSEVTNWGSFVNCWTSAWSMFSSPPSPIWRNRRAWWPRSRILRLPPTERLDSKFEKDFCTCSGQVNKNFWGSQETPVTGPVRCSRVRFGQESCHVNLSCQCGSLSLSVRSFDNFHARASTFFRVATTAKSSFTPRAQDNDVFSLCERCCPGTQKTLTNRETKLVLAARRTWNLCAANQWNPAKKELKGSFRDNLHLPAANLDIFLVQNRWSTSNFHVVPPGVMKWQDTQHQEARGGGPKPLPKW